MQSSTSLGAAGLTAPDLIRPVIGYRSWRLVDGELVSLLGHARWGAEPLRARCSLGRPPHLAPAPSCQCGIYALHRPHRHWGPDGASFVTGAVALWGRLEVHVDGVRAEWGRVVAVALPRWGTGGSKPRVRALAEGLGVEAVPAKRLRAAALAYGEPLSRALLPGRPG